ncbi:MAG: hypothetical protein IT364_08595 [Candidatus Hydrogenedentes bacterium]|nr:hypothetical protein [Candidatus Hydrogenedentota bacterium]
MPITVAVNRLPNFIGKTLHLNTSRRHDRLAVGTIAVLGVLMFADAFARGGDTVATFVRSDVIDYFGELRNFAFGELANGNFPLWNPHIFCGSPCFGAWQAGLFYPFNLVYLALPLPTAVNLDSCFHVTLFGLGMYAWARRHLLPLPALYASVAAMFSGSYFLHVMCGHQPMVACIAWTPPLFIAYDKLRDGGGLGWFLFGAFAAAMQAVSGWPQGLVMVTATFGIYWVLTIPWSERRARVSALMVLMAVTAGLLAAAQLWAGAENSRESVRGGGVPYYYAASFSLPPENLLTLLVPGIFGNEHHAEYYAWNHFWETSLFVGVTTLFFVFYGAFAAPRSRKRVLLPMLVLLLILALGESTPVHWYLYEYVPGFNSVRGMCRFNLYFAVFAALLAGEGIQAMLTAPARLSRMFACVLAVLFAAFLSLAALAWIPKVAGSSLPDTLSWMSDLRDWISGYWPTRRPRTIDQLRFTVYSMLISSATCAALAILCMLARRRRWAVLVLVVFGLVEITAFARIHRGTANLSASMSYPAIENLYVNEPGDYRVMVRTEWNAPMHCNGYGIWGYDAIILDRFAQYIGYSQKIKKRVVDTVLLRMRGVPSYRMLRLRYLVFPKDSEQEPRRFTGDLPRFVFVRDYKVDKGKRVLVAIEDPDFDPARTVVLEDEPAVPPGPAAEGDTLRVVRGDTDYDELEISLASPAILLVTDSYSEHWRVRSLDPAPPQDEYDLMPANYTLRAIPLAAGKHHIVMEYVPKGYVVGRWISLGAWVCFGVLCVVWLVRTRRARSAIPAV